MIEFDRDDANIEHIAEHQLDPEEVEQAMLDDNRIPATAYSTRTERHYGAIGATESGRILFVVYVRGMGFTRSVTARDASSLHKRHYRRSMRRPCDNQRASARAIHDNPFH